MRFYPENFMFNVAGIACFPNENINYILALLNTKLASGITQILNPTINMNAGDVSKLPVLIDKHQYDHIDGTAQSLIEMAKRDWDSFETSWDFKKHPMS